MADGHREDGDLSAERPASGLVVWQPRRGFRYAADAFWLAGFALEAHPRARTALDLGTGSGIVALLLARQGLEVLGVDRLVDWGPLWARTLADSAVPGRVSLRCADVLALGALQADLVVCNPPYFAPTSGPASADPWKRAARTESTASLADFARAAVGALGPEGQALAVLPADRVAEWEVVCREAGAFVAERVWVGARRGLVRVTRAGAESAVESRITESDERAKGWYTRACG